MVILFFVGMMLLPSFESRNHVEAPVVSFALKVSHTISAHQQTVA